MAGQHHTSMSPSSPSSSSKKFIEAALCATGTLALSYVHHRLKWVIRDHLLSLIEEFPSFKPSADHFTHDDGTTVYILNASGTVPLALAPPVPSATVELTIWLLQGYPFVPPIVHLSPAYAAVVDRRNPFVDPSSGATTTPYLRTWQYPHSNLLDLARNLVNVFTLCPPFSTLTPPPLDVVGGSLASRREAMDRLYASLCTDMAAFRALVEEEVGCLMGIQSELRLRAYDVDSALDELHREKESLRWLAAEMEKRAGVVRDWLWANKAIQRAVDEAAAPEEVFELEDDGRSTWLLDSLGACHATDDVVSVLDKALMEGTVPVDGYLKQVRTLSREQFFKIAVLRKL